MDNLKEALTLLSEMNERMRLINGDDRNCCMKGTVCPNHWLMNQVEIFLRIQEASKP